MSKDFFNYNNQLSSAIEKGDSERIKEILITGNHPWLCHRVFEEVFLDDLDSVLLSVLQEIEIDPYSRGLDGDSFVGKAVSRGSLEIVEQLLATGTNCNLVPKDGNYPLYVAAIKSYQDIFDYLFPLTEPQLQEYALTAFVEILNKGKTKTVFCWVNLIYTIAYQIVKVKNKPRADLATKINNSKYPEKEAALWVAAYWGDERLVNTLLTLGVDCNSQVDYQPFLPKNLSDIKHITWQHGQNLSGARNCQDLNIWKVKNFALTPLMVAIASGGVTKDVPSPPGLSHTKVILSLIQAGANFNLRDRDGDTALNWSILWGWTEIVAILVEAGVQVSEVNNIGYTPLMLATYLEHTEIINILKEAEASTSGLDQIELIRAIENQEENHVQGLLEAGVSANSKDYQGNSALKLAIVTEKTEICRMLVQSGADTEFIDSEQHESALLRAIRQGNQEIIQLLIENHSSLNTKGKSWGETALIEAVRYCNLDSVKLLVDTGADLNIKDNFGRTALDYVDMNNLLCSLEITTEIGVLLIEAGANESDNC